ncbi:MAG TPA: DNA mismatch repair endonuclease MutL [Bacteroidales bacterium]|nr:DNA mismatch repair endonuclease MutL [Bacteroidales bacterium]HPF02635.1 DNA mismatch repair endonuclease MutL [Bacteroidales bacterium]HPJ59093.1 DNA mismatch repair endonuclease MutL [Bacteroidales bacterium]HPR11392.1 DNA mismatch repair endonuclease MutL [Bacteroidales bacterium]HRW85657.1 DNA mismatch repair endonuclease MutL [Bacteroidales bacterium]
MSDIIKLLPDSVANQIAAGEVIQRPASVVKELMENAVDAGALHISVIIRDSGKTLIQVIDDGSGMSETDARLSFERHATSKISKADDLSSIMTKGFRGEALASIAAVAMVELRTRREEDEAGTLVIINGSRVETQEPCSNPKGSGFSVRNLFYNVPARRKFLKSDTTEFRHIINEFQKIVLAHTEIHFHLYHNDTVVYNLHPGNRRQRIIAVFGKQMNQELINLETDTSLIAIKGFVGKPESARRTSGDQFFFINNRYMRHPYFHKAVMEAYQNIIAPDVIPAYFIFMESDPSAIDVNIHPTKTEIKFEDERAIWQILMASVREALGRFNIVPSIDFRGEALVDIPVKGSEDTIPGQPEIKINPAYNPFDSDDSGSRPSLAGRFRKEESANWEKLFPGASGSHETGMLPPLTGETARRLFQIRNKYIACPVKSGLMLIDQKRAHERILYEKFINRPEDRIHNSQTELFPVLLDLNPADYQIMKEIAVELEKTGFTLLFQAGNKISVKGRPSELEMDDPAEMISIIIEEFRSNEKGPLQETKERLAAAMAGASAIPYGRNLDQAEMEDIFDRLFACPSPNYSPGGKTIISILTLDELDRRFR